MKNLDTAKKLRFRGMAFYSTPLVFLTDTFTGKILRFCKLRSGHLSGKDVSTFYRTLVPG